MKSTEKKTFKEAAIEALKEAGGEPLSALDICSIARERGWIAPKSKTPEASIGAALYTDIKNKGDASSFHQPESGLFVLSSGMKNTFKRQEEVVYVMINKAMPDHIKVGITTEYGLNSRLKSMDGTNVPFAFKIYYAAVVDHARTIEKKISKIFSEQRASKNREFYSVPAERMKETISMAAKRVISSAEQEPGVNHPPVNPVVVNGKPAEGSKTSSVKEERKPPFRFNHLQIRPGSILYFVKDKEITCEVADDRHVIYKGEKMGLSKAAKLALNSKGHQGKSYQGPPYWEYKGRTLKDIHNSAKQNNKRTSQDSPKTITKDTKKAKVLIFNRLNILVGSTLTFTEDAAITCEVADDSRVIYMGKKMGLSGAAKKAWKLKGGHWKSYRGSKYWKYNGRVLQDILDSI